MYKRATKLWPFHMVMVLITLALVLIPYFYWESVNHNTLTWNDMYLSKIIPIAFILQFFMIDSLNPFFNGINGTAWTLSCLFLCYLTLPFFLRKTKNLNVTKILLAMLACWIVFMIPAQITRFMGYADCMTNTPSDMLSFPHIMDGLLQRSPLVRFPEFVIGILLFRLYQKRETFKLRIAPWLAFTVTGVLMYYLPLRYPYVLLHNGYFTLFEIIIMWSLICSKGPIVKFMSLPWVVELGNASFSLYLLHVTFNQIWVNTDKFFYCLRIDHSGIFSQEFMHRLFTTNYSLQLPSYILFSIVVIALSVVMQRYFVQPISDRLRSLQK